MKRFIFIILSSFSQLDLLNKMNSIIADQANDID